MINIKKYTFGITTFSRLLAILLVGCLLFGCSDTTTQEPPRTISAPSTQLESTADNLNVAVSSSVLEEVAPLLNLYSVMEGVQITITEVPSGSDSEEFIAELTAGAASLIISDNIYNINSLANRGGIAQIRELDSALIAAFAELVPDYMASGDDVAFLPVGIDGYGYIGNTTLLAELIETDDIATLSDNLRDASAIQWQEAVKLLDELILGDISEGEILRLSGGEYELPSQMPEEIENLVAPYAMSLANADVLLPPLSIMLNGDDPTEETISRFADYPEYLYNELTMSATPQGRAELGDDPSTRFSELDSITSAALYEQEKVLFYRTSLSDAFKYLSPEALSESVIFPLRPLISQTGDTATYTLNASMTVSTPFVFAVASDAEQAENAAALDFLVWFYYSETGRSYITDTLGLLEFNRPLAKNPLTVQLYDYIDNNNISIDRLLYTDPKTLLNAKALIYNDYLSFEEWSDETFDQLTTALDETFTTS